MLLNNDVDAEPDLLAQPRRAVRGGRAPGQRRGGPAAPRRADRLGRAVRRHDARRLPAPAGPGRRPRPAPSARCSSGRRVRSPPTGGPRSTRSGSSTRASSCTRRTWTWPCACAPPAGGRGSPFGPVRSTTARRPWGGVRRRSDGGRGSPGGICCGSTASDGRSRPRVRCSPRRSSPAATSCSPATPRRSPAGSPAGAPLGRPRADRRRPRAIDRAIGLRESLRLRRADYARRGVGHAGGSAPSHRERPAVMSVCLVCSATLPQRGLPRATGCTGPQGRSLVVRCPACGAGRTLPPATAAELATYYPSDYGPFEATPGRLVQSISRAIQWWQGRRASRHCAAVVDGAAPGGRRPGRRLRARRSRRLVRAARMAHDGRRALRGRGGRRTGAGRRRPGGGARDRRAAGRGLRRGRVPAVARAHRGAGRRPASASSRALRPGGVVCISVPNFGCWQARRFGSRWFHLDVPRHRTHFTAASLTRALEAAGFTAVRDEHVDEPRGPARVDPVPDLRSLPVPGRSEAPGRGRALRRGAAAGVGAGPDLRRRRRPARRRREARALP